MRKRRRTDESLYCPRNPGDAPVSTNGLLRVRLFGRASCHGLACMVGKVGEAMTTEPAVLTFGAVHAVILPPVREGSLWSHIAVVDKPGIPFHLYPYCARQSVYFLANHRRANDQG